MYNEASVHTCYLFKPLSHFDEIGVWLARIQVGLGSGRGDGGVTKTRPLRFCRKELFGAKLIKVVERLLSIFLITSTNPSNDFSWDNLCRSVKILDNLHFSVKCLIQAAAVSLSGNSQSASQHQISGAMAEWVRFEVDSWNTERLKHQFYQLQHWMLS